MGVVRKVVVVTVVAAGVLGVATVILQRAGAPPDPTGSAEDRCEARIGSRMPRDAFIVMHSAADATGRSTWVIDHGGMRESLACTAKPDGSVVLNGLGHD
jgi:hypothetical protein